MKKLLTWLGIVVLATPLAIAMVIDVYLSVAFLTGDPRAVVLIHLQRPDK